MELKVSSADPANLAVDCLALPVFEELELEKSPLARLDERMGGLIKELMEAKEVKGKLAEKTYLHAPQGVKARRVLLVGCGKPDKLDLRKVQTIVGGGARFARAKDLATLGFFASWPEGVELETQSLLRVAGEALAMALYDSDQYKEKPEQRTLVSVTLALPGKVTTRHRRAAANGLIVGTAVNITRNLVNTPGNDLPPKRMAKHAQAIAKEYGLTYKELDREAMKKLGMGALLGVSQGSAEKPRMIVLTYDPGSDTDTDGEGKGEGRSKTVTDIKSASRDVLTFVGKGITFDTGGISLKPSANMEKMKYDMAGGAAVLGAMAAVGQLKPRVKVIGVVPAVENMPGGRAQRPGDIVKCASGKTVEVINTDAEGRMILADALWYARVKLKATHMVDLATLTGAVNIALGHVHVGIMGNDQELVDRLRAAGAGSGERLWQLPLDEDYKKQLKSDIADMKNVGGRKAGTITAGYFLKEFADPVPWAHLDIAGTAWLDKAKGHLTSGGTGVGVRTLVNLALGW